MSIVGGSPPADVMHGDTTTSDVNGTYFGVVEEGAVVIRNFFITNTGSCPLEISSITSSLSDFVLDGFLFSPTLTPLPYTASIDPGDYAIFRVSFIGPVGGSGTLTSTISISNTDNTTYTFNVSAEMFNFNIPGPGGITADFRLWLKSTRGIVKSGSNITDWIDLGTNGKDATTDPGKEPTYMDTAAENINFNPVIKFENDGAGIEQYMYNATNGFYSQDMFIVMIPDATMTSASPRNTIFSGVSSGNAGDITGVGFGDYSSAFPNETLSYNQNIPGGGSYNGVAESGTSYSNAGIINVRNDSDIVLGGQEILYNSSVLTATSVDDIPYANVGDPGPPTVLGTEYWIGRNFDVVGSLNGRVAEIFTFAERVADADRQKIESYLAIKYGITLGTSTQVEKDYINSFNTSIWDISANTGYNYHVAGIGRDSISDLNQKQSKTLNIANEVTIGLNGIFATNSANTNEFKKDGDFLVWGSNDAAYTASGSNTVTVATGITTSLTRILRQWKIVESIEDAGGDVENVFVSIPSAVFSSFTLGADEEYALVVADNDNFANGDIIDVVPLVSDGAGNLQTWYDFDGTKYFTFAKVSKFSGNHSVSIDADGYLIGEYAINLNIDAFTISAWVKSASSANTRTIMAKGSKLQLRLNPSDQIEVMLDDDVTPRFTSTMVLNDGKWHQVTFVYKSGSIFLYVDGVLDKSEQDVEPPTPNFNRFSVGAVYIDKNNIINPFLGEIDEVYIWDQGLTQDQVRYLMNQEVERFDISGTDYVNGEVLPQASSSNEVTTIPWGDLRTYYDFNSFYGSTVEGRADVRYFLRLKYLDKDKELVDAQTIPVPYVSVANGAWDMPATWRNNADQVLPNSLSLDGVTMVNWNIVEIGHDITSGDRDIALLGLKQTAGKLTIADPVDPQDETNSGQALTVTNYLEIDGIIDLVGESQFIQTEGSVLDADSGGFIERDQQGTANGFNYNYWSSSVGPITGSTVTRGTGVSYLNNNHTIDGVLNDGTDTDLYLGIDFITNQNTGSGPPPPPGSAKEISSYWLYKFYGPEDNYFSWESIDQNTSLQAGEGFTMKGTLGAVAITDQQNYVFTGLPNNGDITLPLDKSSGDVDRLIGNPYPSAIDATEFILDNMSIANGGNNASGTIFNGALYFWDHFGEQNTHVLKGYVGGYATYNLTGGAAAISNDVRINNDMSSGSKIPGQYIPVNQGFFVSTAIDGFTDDNGAVISVVDGGDIVFKNSQRVFATEQAASSIFLRDSNKSKTTGDPQNKTSNLTKSSSIRLMYSSPKGYHRQLLLGTNTNASKGFDLGYDAFMIDVNEEDVYWDIAQRKFVIQGVDNFDYTNEFPLGLIVKNSGIVKIKLEAVENLETAKTLYIKDNVTNETVLINNKPFEMFLDAGTYQDRFSLVFQSQSLTTEDVEIADNVSVYFDKSISELKVRGLNDSELLSITLFNIIGQEIKFIDYTSNKTSKQVHVNTGAYIVQLNTDKGTINKKIIIE
ncbi:LamG-like jellyroll fold domain-containing protein [Hwangdonia sp.]|uniref:LamG-like jellyroll fold domain-containing protein n=1 Tax=Hwangdonia sp. TaxID=1883432 RepID=UPI003AB42481